MIRTLLALFPAYRHRLLRMYLCLAVLGVLFRATGAVLLLPLVSALFGTAPSDAWVWVGLLVVVTVIGWLVDALVARIGFELGFGLLDRTQHDVAERLGRVGLGWFTTENTANARQAIAATGPSLVGMIIYLITPLIGALLLPPALALALLPIAWPLAVAALAGVPVLLVAFWAGGRFSRAADRVAEQSNNLLTERILEFARTQRALRAGRRVDPARSLVGSALAAQHGASVRLLLMQIPGRLIFSVATQIALLVLAGTATWLAATGAMGVPETIAFIVVIARYLEPFAALADLNTALESTGLTLDRIRAVLEAPVARPRSDQDQQNGPATSVDGPPRVEFCDVTFGYPSAEQPVISGLDLVLEAGSTTAIVGPSGSGKSTILALAAGLREPTGGQVLINGEDLAALDADAHERLVSVVFQQPYLFAGSVEDNVRTGDPTAPTARVEQAMALARVDELTGRLADGAGTAVGEAGSALSGGERQRVSIARAVLKPAPLLLIDEATSALDSENQQAVVDALASDPQARTRVIVAHRLASIRGADRVIFIDQGRILEEGTVPQLLAAGGRFAGYWRAQEDSSRWQLAAGSPTTHTSRTG